MSGAGEVFALGMELEAASRQVLDAVHGPMQDASRDVRDQWRAGVREKAPKHLPHLPAAITFETKVSGGNVVADIGPESGKTQGRLGRGEELGSRNQPPHLSGLTAFTSVQDELARSAADAVERIIP